MTPRKTLLMLVQLVKHTQVLLTIKAIVLHMELTLSCVHSGAIVAAMAIRHILHEHVCTEHAWVLPDVSFTDVEPWARQDAPC